MNLLLDTHILLCFKRNDCKLLEILPEVITNPKNLVFVSSVSAWEISIKQSLGKLIAPSNLEEALRFSRFEVLSMTLAHGIKVADLPMHHKHPFDRMLIAQALVEGLTHILHLLVVEPNCHLPGARSTKGNAVNHLLRLMNCF